MLYYPTQLVRGSNYLHTLDIHYFMGREFSLLRKIRLQEFSKTVFRNIRSLVTILRPVSRNAAAILDELGNCQSALPRGARKQPLGQPPRVGTEYNLVDKQIPSQIEYYIILKIQLQTLNNKYFYKPTLFSCLSYTFIKKLITRKYFHTFGFTNGNEPVLSRINELEIKRLISNRSLK